jgi:transposase-like protein
MTKPIARDPIYRGRRFQSEIIELCVRWYLTYRLSYRDLVAMMAERGVTLSHTTIFRWVQRYVPEFERRWSRYAKPVHSSWRMDETAIPVRGGPLYLYRAVDKFGKTVDSLLCADRTEAAARAFFCKALQTNQPHRPLKVNLDGNAASHRALRLLRREHPVWQHVVVRSRRYLNNIVEQDHRAVKRRCASMLALKSFPTAAITLAGVELAHRIRKGQFSFGSDTPTESLSLRHLWNRGLEQPGDVANSKRRRRNATRPPMHQNSGGRLLTEEDVGNVLPVRYPRKVSVGRALFLHVTPKGHRSWRYKYRFAGKCTQVVLGTYPEISLECARSRHQFARTLLAQGTDPSALKASLGKHVFVLKMQEWETARCHDLAGRSRPDGAR